MDRFRAERPRIELILSTQYDEEWRVVRATGGVTIVTAKTARQLTVEGVVYRPFVEPAPPVDVGLAWRAEDSSPVLKALVEIAQHFAEMSPG